MTNHSTEKALADRIRPAGRSLGGPAPEGMVNEKKVRGRGTPQRIGHIMINGLYVDTKRKAAKRVK